MRADRIERDSPTWLAVSEWAESRLAELRKKNDGNHDAVATAQLRGQIAALKQLQALPTAAPAEPGEA